MLALRSALLGGSGRLTGIIIDEPQQSLGRADGTMIDNVDTRKRRCSIQYASPTFHGPLATR